MSANPKAVLQCPICLSAPSDPVCFRCGHTACWSCVADWLDRNGTCPVCRARIDIANDVFPIYGAGVDSPAASAALPGDGTAAPASRPLPHPYTDEMRRRREAEATGRATGPVYGTRQGTAHSSSRGRVQFGFGNPLFPGFSISYSSDPTAGPLSPLGGLFGPGIGNLDGMSFSQVFRTAFFPQRTSRARRQRPADAHDTPDGPRPVQAVPGPAPVPAPTPDAAPPPPRRYDPHGAADDIPLPVAPTAPSAGFMPSASPPFVPHEHAPSAPPMEPQPAAHSRVRPEAPAPDEAARRQIRSMFLSMFAVVALQVVASRLR
jgi:hypothetical protein